MGSPSSVTSTRGDRESRRNDQRKTETGIGQHKHTSMQQLHIFYQFFFYTSKILEGKEGTVAKICILMKIKHCNSKMFVERILHQVWNECLPIQKDCALNRNLLIKMLSVEDQIIVNGMENGCSVKTKAYFVNLYHTTNNLGAVGETYVWKCIQHLCPLVTAIDPRKQGLYNKESP